ncbi:hypothetical protein [Rhodococcus sp. DMU1]|uniref:hypothetical protein n=1 Tax=Rhodococcus sp. DMU1 TaxID=2722825 RepID=UPI001FF0A38D|nr:hypothetical protein [Rhodococcus sp. DMU1]
MKNLATFLGVLSAVFGAIVLRPVNSYQAFMWKSTATAQTPGLVLLGSLAAVLGMKQRSPLAVITGTLGAGIGVTYIQRTVAPHNGFARAFGRDWQRRIPPEAEQRMLRRRLTWRLPRVPEPRLTRNVPFCTIPGTNRRLLADIWQPPVGVESSGTAIVHLYGGSWHFFDKDVLTRPLFRQLAGQAMSSWTPRTAAARRRTSPAWSATSTARWRGSRRTRRSTGSTPGGWSSWAAPPGPTSRCWPPMPRTSRG